MVHHRPHAPLGLVSFTRVSESSADYYTDFIRTISRFFRTGTPLRHSAIAHEGALETRGTKSSTVGKHFTETPFSLEGDRLFHVNLLSFASYLLVGNGELMASFSSSAIENFASAFSFHARAESVNFDSLFLMRLVGPFHNFVPLIFY